MKKGMKHAKERAGRVLNKLRPASGSQSSATPEVELSSVTPSLPPYILAAVNELKTLATRADQLQTPPLEIQIADALSAGPDSIPPTSSTGETDSDDQKALKVSSRSDGSVSNELSETALLPMDVSLGSPPSLGDPLDAVSRSSQAILNNNQNTTYNFGRDVINYNPVINLNYNTRGEEDTMKLIKMAIGNRFVPTALYEVQSEEAGCMNGTRRIVLSMFMEWARNDPMRIFWLAGMAGTGKTSIAVTLCRMLKEDRAILLGGTFFCSRTANIKERTEVRCIIPTLAVALAERSTTFAEALAAVLTSDSRVALKPISTQIEVLLQLPLAALVPPPHSIVFVVDALDECIDEDEVKKLLQAISGLKSEATIKFILTSRPETHIGTSPIASLNHNSILRLHTINKEEVTEDIRLYISNVFARSPLTKPWYSEADVGTLATLSEGLFIFASTIVSYVLKVHSAKGRATRLQTALLAVQRSKVVLGPLDAMYEFVLTRASDTAEIEPQELEATLQVLASILASRMPLSVRALAELLTLETDELRESLQRLHAVVYVPEDEDRPGLRTLHASFGDYLLERTADRLRISKSEGHDRLACGCLRIMRNQLHFNISKSRSSYEQNPAEKPRSISLSLEYACMQWIYHVAALAESRVLENEVDKTMRRQLLFWLEVMSVLGEVWRSAAMLLFAASIFVEASEFLHDAHVFVTSSRAAIERSAAHIYISALPFAAKDSLVYRTFFRLFTGLISVETFGVDRHGGELVMTFIGHTNSVCSVAYSPDGGLIASSSSDGTVRIWETRSGDEVKSPLISNNSVNSVMFAPDGRSLAAGTDAGEIWVWDISFGRWTPQRLLGHSGRVTCVHFSSNSTLIASGSDDQTVQLWRFETGENVSVMKGHGAGVTTVSFSSVGDILASGSYDRTIRLWRTTTGEQAGQPLRGHTNSIISASFSPNGEKLVSSSYSDDFRLWETQTWNCIATLRGHSDWVLSVQFSPDGNSLLSAADDGCLRIWTLQQTLGEPLSVTLEGHEAPILSATFSPDGQYIASASSDSTIRIWNTGSDRSGVQSLHAHADAVRAVAVSANGEFIVSGSTDCTIRIWSSKTGEPRLPPLLGHTEPVRSVAISPDGYFLASASKDHTLRLWNVQTGDLIGSPLQGNDSDTSSTAFSPDSRWLVSGSDQRTVRIWDVATRQESQFSPLQCDTLVLSIVFSPNSSFVAVSDLRGHINFWHMHTGQRVHPPFHANASGILSISFSPTGTRIVSGGTDSIGRIWDLSSRHQILALEGHSDWIYSVAFSASGQLIGTGAGDNTVRLWNAETGSQLAMLCGHNGNVRSVAFTPDGQSIVSGSSDSTIRIWDAIAACSGSSDNVNNLDPATALESAGLKDGWLLGHSGELLLWVPAEYRAFLDSPTCRMLIAKYRIVVNSGEIWHHGGDWTACWRGSSVT